MQVTKKGLSELRVDENYQRGFRKSHVKKIIDNFDEIAFGRILVGRRSDGTLWIVDGQHRYFAAKEMGLTKVPVSIFESEGLSHEADMFLKANSTRRVSGMDKLHAGYCSGQVWAKEIVDTLAKRGLEMAFRNKKAKWPYLGTSEPLVMLHEKAGAEGIAKLARVLVEGFKCHDPDATNSVVVSGVCYFLSTWPDADAQRLIDVVSRKSMSASKLIRDANAINMTGGGNSRRKCAGQILWKWYNRQLKRDRKLPAINILEAGDE